MRTSLYYPIDATRYITLEDHEPCYRVCDWNLHDGKGWKSQFIGGSPATISRGYQVHGKATNHFHQIHGPRRHQTKNLHRLGPLQISGWAKHPTTDWTEYLIREFGNGVLFFTTLEDGKSGFCPIDFSEVPNFRKKEVEGNHGDNYGGHISVIYNT